MDGRRREGRRGPKRGTPRGAAVRALPNGLAIAAILQWRIDWIRYAKNLNSRTGPNNGYVNSNDTVIQHIFLDVLRQ